MRTNLLRILVFGFVIAIAAIGVAGAIGTGSRSATRAELEAKVAALEQDRGGASAARKRGLRGRRGRRGERGPKGETGATGPAGADGTDHVYDLSVNWRNGASAGRDSASVAIPGIGTLAITCNPAVQNLTLTPAQNGPRTVMTLTSFQGAGTFNNALNDRYFSSSPAAPIVINPSTFPINGMIAGTLSVEVTSGDGAAGATPATLNLTSYVKVNDPTPSENYCYIAGQVISGS